MVRVKYSDVDQVPKLPKLWWFGYDAKAIRLMKGFTEFLFANRLAQRGLAAVRLNLGERFV
jgi:hypothetical protein